MGFFYAGYQREVRDDFREVEIEARDWGTVFGQHGPVYTRTNQAVCNAATEQDYHLRVTPLCYIGQLYMFI